MYSILGRSVHVEYDVWNGLEYNLFIYSYAIFAQTGQIEPYWFKMKAGESNETASTSINYALNKWQIKSIQAYRTFNQSINFFFSIFQYLCI